MPDEMFAFAESARRPWAAGHHRRRRRRRTPAGDAGRQDHRARCSACRSPSRHLGGQDSLYSIVQMPAGVPVATFAIGEAGATNAALFAVALLAAGDAALTAALDAYRRQRHDDAAAAVLPPRMTSASMITPPATLGILGGGQLGRYFVMAARTMGYRTIVLEPDPNAPAGGVADEHLVAAYDDRGSAATSRVRVRRGDHRVRESSVGGDGMAQHAAPRSVRRRAPSPSLRTVSWRRRSSATRASRSLRSR